MNKKKSSLTFNMLKIMSFLSDMSIEKRKHLIMLLSVLPVLILTIIIVIVSILESDRYQHDYEEKMITASEQYINSSIENVISVAKTVYTNNIIYEFLNTNYENQIAYYDAFYKLTENNSLTMAENNNISKFTIYTENETVTSGGNIEKITDNTKAENWYKEFSSIHKNMIVYCDTEKSSLSLIRKLDYYNTGSRECILKIDFNRSAVYQCLSNLNFNGKIFVMSNGRILYSNMEKVTDEDKIISTDFSCFTKNYYSTDLEYYVQSDKSGMLDTLRYNYPFIIVFAVLMLICIIFLYMVIDNLLRRISTINRCIQENETFLSLTGHTAGNDEAGQIYEEFVDLIKSLDKNKNDYKQCLAMLNKSHEDNYILIMQALEADTALTYTKIYGNDKLDDVIPLNAEKNYKIPLRKEFDIIESLPVSRNIKITVPDTVPENLMIRPVLLWNIARSISESVSKYNPDTPVSIDISLEHDDNSFTVAIKHNGTVPSKYILKLKAIFEDIPGSSDFTFRPQYAYNPYIHIKKYYGRLLNTSVSSDSGFKLVLKFRNS